MSNPLPSPRDSELPPFLMLTLSLALIFTGAFNAVASLAGLFRDSFTFDAGALLWLVIGYFLLRGGNRTWVLFRAVLLFSAVVLVVVGIISLFVTTQPSLSLSGFTFQTTPSVIRAIFAVFVLVLIGLWWALGHGKSAQWFQSSPHDNAPVVRRLFWAVFVFGGLFSFMDGGVSFVVRRAFDSIHVVDTTITAVDARTGTLLPYPDVCVAGEVCPRNPSSVRSVLPDRQYPKGGTNSVIRLSGFANVDCPCAVSASGYRPADIVLTAASPRELTVRLEPLAKQQH